MPPPTSASAHSFNKILNAHRSATRTRSAVDIEESIKKLRRLILVDGIPSSAVSLLSLTPRMRTVLTSCCSLCPRGGCAFVLFWLCGMHTQDSTLRPRIWKILLRVHEISAETFLEYVGRGPCEVKEKIRNDTFRLLLPFLLPAIGYCGMDFADWCSA